jgi:GNAT superfamily N-acetyltransferase
MEIRTPQTASEWEQYYDLRYRILREPLGKERGSERNEGDETGTHFALFERGIILGVARLDKVDSEICQVRFVAIETEIQGEGYGKKLMNEIEQEGERMGYKKMILHARDYALPFYEKLNYTLIRASYKLFDVLQHFEMHKNL